MTWQQCLKSVQIFILGCAGQNKAQICPGFLLYQMLRREIRTQGAPLTSMSSLRAWTLASSQTSKLRYLETSTDSMGRVPQKKSGKVWYFTIPPLGYPPSGEWYLIFVAKKSRFPNGRERGRGQQYIWKSYRRPINSLKALSITKCWLLWIYVIFGIFWWFFGFIGEISGILELMDINIFIESSREIIKTNWYRTKMTYRWPLEREVKL